MFENKLKILQGELSLGDFAKKLGTPKTTVHQYLNGRPFPFEFAVLVCERFGCDLNWLACSKEGVAEPNEHYKSETLTPEEKELLRRFRKLSNWHQQMTLETMAGYEHLSEGRVEERSAVCGSEVRNFKRRSTD